jgi:hypothetical protein
LDNFSKFPLDLSWEEIVNVAKFSIKKRQESEKLISTHRDYRSKIKRERERERG